MVKRIHTARQFRPVINALGKVAVTGGAFRGKDFFALDCIALTVRQARPIGVDVQIPGGDFLWQGSTAQAECLRSRWHGQQCGNRTDGD